MLGFNYRMTDIQAALGKSQVLRLDEKIKRRNTLACRYNDALQGLRLQLPTVLPENRSSFHLYVVRLKAMTSSKNHLQVFEKLRLRGIGVNLHYMPVHLQWYYRDLGFKHGAYPEAEAYGVSAITLPLFSSMTDETQNQVILAFQDIL